MYQVVIDKLKSHLFGQICHQHFIIKYLKWKKRRKPTQHEEYLSMCVFYVRLNLVGGSNPYLYGIEKTCKLFVLFLWYKNVYFTLQDHKRIEAQKMEIRENQLQMMISMSTKTH